MGSSAGCMRMGREINRYVLDMLSSGCLLHFQEKMLTK